MGGVVVGLNYAGLMLYNKIMIENKPVKLKN